MKTPDNFSGGNFEKKRLEDLLYRFETENDLSDKEIDELLSLSDKYPKYLNETAENLRNFRRFLEERKREFKAEKKLLEVSLRSILNKSNSAETSYVLVEGIAEKDATLLDIAVEVLNELKKKHHYDIKALNISITNENIKEVLWNIFKELHPVK